MTIKQRLQAGTVFEHPLEKVDIEVIEGLSRIDFRLQLKRSREALFLHALDDHGQHAFIHRIQLSALHTPLRFRPPNIETQYRPPYGVPMKR